MATYQLISSVTVGSGGAASIDFTSIPATYTDLCVKLSMRSTRADSADYIYLTFNGSATGYSRRLLGGYGSSTFSSSDSGSSIYYPVFPAANSTASTFSNTEIYIPNYAGSNNKSVSIDSVWENNSATLNELDLMAGLWSNTAAITSIKLAPQVANFAQYTTGYLYGIKNS